MFWGIKYKKQNQFLVDVLFWGPYIIAPLIQLLHFPTLIKYGLDVIWLFLLATMLFCKKRIVNINVEQLYIWVWLFLGYVVVNYMFHFQSIFYLLWGIRNNFRGYILFFAVIFYLNATDIKEYLIKIDKIFWVHSLIMFIQHTFFGYKQDYLGGLFGVKQGCNGDVNLFFCIILAKSVLFFLKVQFTRDYTG